VPKDFYNNYDAELYKSSKSSIKLKIASVRRYEEEIGIVGADKDKERNWRVKLAQQGEYNNHKIDAETVDGIVNPAPELKFLPPYSFFLNIKFKLLRPYLSIDDNPFHYHDNPLRRDRTFGLPIIPGTTWKGALRWVYYKCIEEGAGKVTAEARFNALFLFGDESKAITKWLDDEYKSEKVKFYDLKKKAGLDNSSHRGRLMFFPTFFNKVTVEVINPHDRKTKKGTHPIYFDAVPTGESGQFRLMYIPFDLMGTDRDIAFNKAKNDAQIIFNSVDTLLNRYGVSAKRSSGYGAMESVKHKLVVKNGDDLFQTEFQKLFTDKVCQK